VSFDDWTKIAQIVSPILIGLIGAWFKATVGRINDRHDEFNRRLARHEAEISQLQETTVKREDWIRESARTCRKLDHLIEGQGRIEGKAEMATAIAAAIRSLIDETRRSAERATPRQAPEEATTHG